MADLPSPPGSRMDRQALARRVLAQRRQQIVISAIYLIVIAVLLGVVAWHSEWRWWTPLGIAWALAFAYGQQAFSMGWDLRELDERVRTMGEWRVAGAGRNGAPVTLAGHMVYRDRNDTGRLTSFVHVDLSARD